MCAQTKEINPVVVKSLHDAFNHISTVMVTAQYCLRTPDLSAEMHDDLSLIVETTRKITGDLRRLAEALEEEAEA